MEDIIVRLGDKHRVVIDDLNHTLQQRRQKKKGGTFWHVLGYYQTFGAITKRLATSSEIEKKEYEAVEYADQVIKKAMSLCDELKGRTVK